VILALPTGTPTVIVGLGDPVAVQHSIAANERSYKEQGYLMLSNREALARLTGLDAPHTPDPIGLVRMIADARQLESRFESKKANELRRLVYAAYEQALWPDAELRSLAAQALHDLAASFWAEGHADDAQKQATLALLEFPDQPVDERRHAPSMRRRFDQVFAGLGPVPRGTVSIVVDRPATIFVDGLRAVVGVTTGRLDLQTGKHRIWAADDFGRSLSQCIELGQSEVMLRFNLALDERLAVEPNLALRCSGDCVSALRQLGERLGARVVGVEPIPSGDKGVRLSTTYQPGTPESYMTSFSAG